MLYPRDSPSTHLGLGIGWLSVRTRRSLRPALMALVIGAFMTLMAVMKVAISAVFGDAARFDLSFPAWLVCSWGTAGLVAGPIAACLPISRRAARIMHAVLFSYLSAAIFSLLVHLERDTEIVEILLGSVVFGSLTLLVAYLVERAGARNA